MARTPPPSRRNNARRPRSRSPHPGEQGQSILIEQQASLHRLVSKQQRGGDTQSNFLIRPFSRSSSGTSLRSFGSSNNGTSDQLPLLQEQTTYGSSSLTEKTLRFQVVVWYIGKLDVVTGSLPMTFRVTLFWNDDSNTINNNSGSMDTMDTMTEEDTKPSSTAATKIRNGCHGGEHQQLCLSM